MSMVRTSRWNEFRLAAGTEPESDSRRRNRSQLPQDQAQGSAANRETTAVAGPDETAGPHPFFLGENFPLKQLLKLSALRPGVEIDPQDQRLSGCQPRRLDIEIPIAKTWRQRLIVIVHCSFLPRQAADTQRTIL